MKPEGRRFEDRVRFNWGFHDGALFVERPMTRAIDWSQTHVRRHFDKVYQAGFVKGHRAAMNGESTELSDKSWTEYRGELKAGREARRRVREARAPREDYRI